MYGQMHAQTMDKNIALLKEYPKAVIQVVSHCDSRGPKAYNMILSARRAKSTRGLSRATRNWKRSHSSFGWCG